MGSLVFLDQVKDQFNQIMTRVRGLKQSAHASSSIRAACDLGKNKIVFMEVEKNGDQILLTRFHKVSRPEAAAELTHVLRQAADEIKLQTQRLRISVKGQGVVIRFVQFPIMSEEELRSAITFEAEKYIPFKADEVVVDFFIVDPQMQSGSGKVMNVLLVAVKKEEVYPLIQSYQAAGFELELIDVDSLAFLNVLDFFYPEESTAGLGILDLGSEVSTFGIMKDNKPQFIRDVSFGGSDIIKRLKRKLGLSLQEIVPLLSLDSKPNPEIEQAIIEGLAALVGDLKVSLDFYSDQAQISQPFKKMFLSGAVGYQPIVAKTIAGELGIEVVTLDVLKKAALAPGLDPEIIRQNEAFLAIPLGLCVREL